MLSTHQRQVLWLQGQQNDSLFTHYSFCYDSIYSKKLLQLSISDTTFNSCLYLLSCCSSIKTVQELFYPLPVNTVAMEEMPTSPQRSTRCWREVSKRYQVKDEQRNSIDKLCRHKQKWHTKEEAVNHW